MKNLFIILVLLVGFSCANAQNDLQPKEFVEKYKATKNAQLLDVRTPEEWANGKIASSKCVNFNDANFKKNLESLDKNKPVFVYCAAGGRSSKAKKVLQEAGFKEIYNLVGGGYQQVAAAGIK
ncbi:MAG: rhodanese-like domain-containing protein [Spirosomaceae bacterium]|nr:rhodanese-like domain-containing protein [Spirosomataceae bacterium]